MMNRSLVTVVAGSLLLLLVLLPESTLARPSDIIRRYKRVSDQRLAELETLLALATLKGKLVTVPVGFGLVDPAKIGRKRRSSLGNDSMRLQRIYDKIAMNSGPTNDDIQEIDSSSEFQKDVDNQLGSEPDVLTLY